MTGDPCLFLSRVLWKELGFEGGEFKQLAAIVHGVLLESGFVGFDPSLRKRVDRLDIPDGWPWTESAEFRYTYTLFEILQANQDDHGPEIPTNQTRFLSILGSGSASTSGLSRVQEMTIKYPICLSLTKSLSAIGFLSGKSKKQAYELWKSVKDELGSIPARKPACQNCHAIL